MRKVPRSLILDKLHRGFVITCVGVTIVSTAFIAKHAYHYFTVIRPQQKKFLQIQQEELLREGAPDSILLKDKAANIAM